MVWVHFLFAQHQVQGLLLTISLCCLVEATKYQNEQELQAKKLIPYLVGRNMIFHEYGAIGWF